MQEERLQDLLVALIGTADGEEYLLQL